MPIDEQIEFRVLHERRSRNRFEAPALILRPVHAGRGGAAERYRGGEIGMQPSKGRDRKTISHDRPHHAVASVFAVAKAVAVLDSGAPAGDVAGPVSDSIFGADVLAKDLAAPAVVIAGDPQDRHSGVVQLGHRRQRAKASPGNHGLPFEPEVEEIAVDDERGGSSLETSQKANELALGVARRDAEVRVRYYVTRGWEWGRHATSLALHGIFTKHPSAGILPHAMITTTEFRVRYAETDQMGVVYHSNYLIWCEIGRTDFIRELGTPYAELEKRNVALAVVEATIRFHSAARYDELIRVKTSLRSARSRMITFDYQIENAETGKLLVSASTTLASLTRESKPTSLPPELRKQLENAIAP